MFFPNLQCTSYCLYIKLNVMVKMKQQCVCICYLLPVNKLYHVLIVEATIDLELLQVTHMCLLVLAKGDCFDDGRPLQLQCKELKNIGR